MDFGTLLERFGWPTVVIFAIGFGVYRGLWPFVTTQVWPFIVRQIEGLQLARVKEREDFLKALQEQQDRYIDQLQDLESAQSKQASVMNERIHANTLVLQRVLRLFEREGKK